MIKDPRSLQDLRDDTDCWYDEMTYHLKCRKFELDSENLNTSKVRKEKLAGWLENTIELLDTYK